MFLNWLKNRILLVVHALTHIKMEMRWSWKLSADINLPRTTNLTASTDIEELLNSKINMHYGFFISSLLRTHFLPFAGFCFGAFFWTGTFFGAMFLFCFAFSYFLACYFLRFLSLISCLVFSRRASLLVGSSSFLLLISSKLIPTTAFWTLVVFLVLFF